MCRMWGERRQQPINISHPSSKHWAVKCSWEVLETLFNFGSDLYELLLDRQCSINSSDETGFRLSVALVGGQLSATWFLMAQYGCLYCWKNFVLRVWLCFEMTFCVFLSRRSYVSDLRYPRTTEVCCTVLFSYSYSAWCFWERKKSHHLLLSNTQIWITSYLRDCLPPEPVFDRPWSGCV